MLTMRHTNDEGTAYKDGYMGARDEGAPVWVLAYRAIAWEFPRCGRRASEGSQGKAPLKQPLTCERTKFTKLQQTLVYPILNYTNIYHFLNLGIQVADPGMFLSGATRWQCLITGLSVFLLCFLFCLETI